MARATVLADYHRLLNLAGYQDVVAKDADTALKVNISWHFFYPGSSTTPWQLEGSVRAMKQDGYDPNLIHACHNSFWYPVKAKRMMHDVLDSVWGRLFRHWEVVKADDRGYPSIPGEGAEIKRTGLRALWRSLGILATCIKEAPEFGARRRRTNHG